MNGNAAGETALLIASPGHAVFATTMIGLGILGLVQGRFTPIWSGIPKGFPARPGLVYFCAMISLLSGIGLLWRRTAAAASRVLLTTFLIWLVLVRASRIFIAPRELNSWWSCGATAVMTATAWVLYVWFAQDRDAPRLRFAASERVCAPRGCSTASA